MKTKLPDLPAHLITPEPVYRARRQLMQLGLASPLLALAGCAGAEDAGTPAPAATAAAGASGIEKRIYESFEKSLKLMRGWAGVSDGVYYTARALGK